MRQMGGAGVTRERGSEIYPPFHITKSNTRSVLASYKLVAFCYGAIGGKRHWVRATLSRSKVGLYEVDPGSYVNMPRTRTTPETAAFVDLCLNAPKAHNSTTTHKTIPLDTRLPTTIMKFIVKSLLAAALLAGQVSAAQCRGESVGVFCFCSVIICHNHGRRHRIVTILT